MHFCKRTKNVTSKTAEPPAANIEAPGPTVYRHKNQNFIRIAFLWPLVDR